MCAEEKDRAALARACAGLNQSFVQLCQTNIIIPVRLIHDGWSERVWAQFEAEASHFRAPEL